MNILFIDCDLGTAFQAGSSSGLLSGHDVRHVSPAAGGIVPVGALLRAAGTDGAAFRPDLIVQQEHLDRRIFLSGLTDLDCPKIFWSVDSHLNMFWHRWYGRLFDVVLSPHASLFAALPQAWRPAPVQGFALPGYQRAWRPHARRQHTASFVGRITPDRPERAAFAGILQARHGVVPCTLPFDAMLDRYDDTRLLPNESIGREFNYRIMEGASSGCCVLTEDIGADLGANFEPGREVLTYRDALELDELLTFLAARPAFAEKIGLAAYQRVQAQHLPQHRAEAIVRMASTLAASRHNRADDQRNLALASVQWARAYPALREHVPQLARQLDREPPHPDVQAMRLRLLVEDGRMAEARALLDALVPDMRAAVDSGRPVDIDLLTACAVAALRLGDVGLLQSLWPLCPAPLAAQTPRPATLFQGCLAWADMLAQTGRTFQAGFHFDPARHCPETALEMTLMASQWLDGEADNLVWNQRMLARCAGTPFVHMELDYAAQLCQHAPDDWRAQLRHGATCLRAYRLDEGLAAIARARQLAQTAGEDAEFKKAWPR